MDQEEKAPIVHKNHLSGFLRQFVLTLVVIAGAGFASSAWGDQKSSSSYPPDLHPFLTSYFAAWSAGDMKAYETHFHKSARIYYVNPQRQVTLNTNLKTFISHQISILAKGHMTERMVHFSGDVDERAASLSVKWELSKGNRVTTGIDRFTLIRDPSGRWKILALLFYEDGAQE